MIKNVPQAIVTPLLSWYDGSARTLPWRDEPSPYRIWISEIMLQQTRVEAGKPYFERFVAEIPNVFALAEADDQKLNKLWEGLGYYSRVRNLKKAAQIVVREYGGALPSQANELVKLPGIGAYTAGAIASIAFHQKVPAVDGNVLRVLSRLTASRDNILEGGAKDAAAEALRQILPERIDAFNQALMELGALICLPGGAPKCGVCPLRTECAAYRLDLQKEIPVRLQKLKRRQQDRTMLLFTCEGRLLLHRRPPEGLLADLWEYPALPEKWTQEELQKHLRQEGIEALSVTAAPDAKHVFSHLVWNMIGYRIEARTYFEMKNAVWATPEELRENYPVPSAFKIYTKWLLEQLATSTAASFPEKSRAALDFLPGR